MYRLGIDLGGTKIEGCVLGDEHQELFRKRIATEQEGGYEHILTRIDLLYQDMAQSIDQAPHTLGIGTPGSLTVQTHLMKNSNTVCLNGKPFKEDLQKKLQKEFVIQNDANCFALAEAQLGAAQGKELVFGVIMGTGCGGGIIWKNQIWEGPQRIGGEWGHMVLDPQGAPCYCGQNGCVETFLSGSGLEKRYQKETGESLPLVKIVEAYRSGNTQAQSFMEAFFEHFGRAVANLMNALDPEIIVLGGGVSNIDEIYTLGAEQVGRYIFSDELTTPIVKHRLGDSAGVLGACLIGS